MSERYLWQFSWYFRRGGEVESLFVATEKEIEELIGKYCYFGEILGKHSEVCGTINEGDIRKLDVSSQAVEEVARLLGGTWSGYNPLEYAYKQCERVDEDGDRCEESCDPDDMPYHEGKHYCYDCYEEIIEEIVEKGESE